MKHRGPLILVFLLVAAAIGFAGAGYYRHQKRHVFAATFRELATIADLKVRDITLWQRERLADADVLAANPAVTAAFDGASTALPHLTPSFKEWLETFRQRYGYESVFILIKDGTPVVTSPHGNRLDPSLKRHIAQNPPHEAAFTPFFKDAQRKPFLGVCAPIRRAGHSSVIGFVILQIDPSKFLYPYIQLWPTPSPSGETMLVEREGERIRFLNELRHRTGTALSLSLPLERRDVASVQAVLRRSGETEAEDYRGVVVLASFRPVPRSGWVVVAKIDLDETLDPLKQSEILLAALVIALVGGCGLMFLFLARRREMQAYRAEKQALEERDRARSELLEAVKHEERRFRQLAEAMPQLVWMTTADGSLDFWNSRWSIFTGISLDAAKGDGWMQALHPGDRERTNERWYRSVLTGEPYETEYRFRRSDGEYRWFLARGLPLRNENGGITRWFGTCTDISDMKQLEQERGMYVHTISHDLRTPLAAIHGHIQLLSLMCTDEASRIHTDAIMQTVERTMAMIADLVDAARLEGGQLVLTPKRIELSQFVEELLQRNAPALGTKRIHAVIPADTPAVLADADRLERAVLNLLTNALKYSPDDATVNVTAERAETAVRLTVTDRGRGIAPEDLPHIFERFHKTKHGRKAGGVGLGLYITKKLMEAQGGRVEVVSEPDNGSSFTLVLPVADASPPGTSP